jgi:hypothetical protein
MIKPDKIKKIVLSLVVLLILSISLHAQKCSGIIYYFNGDSTKFNDVTFIYGLPVNSQPSFASNEPQLYIYYNNSLRNIPLTKMISFEILSIEDSDSQNYKKCTVKIITKTGIEVINDSYFFRRIKIVIFDKLTGEIKDQEIWAVKQPNQPNIKKIVFN